MKFIATVALVLCFALLVSANARSPLSVLSKPQPLSRTLNPPMEPFAFSYSNCGNPPRSSFRPLSGFVVTRATHQR